MTGIDDECDLVEKTPPPARRLSSRISYQLLCLFGIAALNIAYGPWRLRDFVPGGRSREEEEDDEADDIVRRSFATSYALLLPCHDDDDDDDDDTRGSGRKDGGLWKPNSWKSCVKKNLAHFDDVTNNNGTAPSIPWWLLTLLRDTTRNMAYGPWHRFGTTDPPLNFCAIEKVGSTEWRNVFCDANADDCANPTPERGGPGGGNPKRRQCALFRGKNCTMMTTRDMPEDAPWAVFLRDPLERVLSGFLDKCYDAGKRKLQGHCEPNALFNPRPNMMDARGRQYPSLMEHLEGREKQFFAAYLDVLPEEVSFAISAHPHGLRDPLIGVLVTSNE
jgi:hypothetical protein